MEINYYKIIINKKIMILNNFNKIGKHKNFIKKLLT